MSLTPQLISDSTYTYLNSSVTLGGSSSRGFLTAADSAANAAAVNAAARKWQQMGGTGRSSVSSGTNSNNPDGATTGQEWPSIDRRTSKDNVTGDRRRRGVLKEELEEEGDDDKVSSIERLRTHSE